MRYASAERGDSASLGETAAVSDIHLADLTTASREEVSECSEMCDSLARRDGC